MATCSARNASSMMGLAAVVLVVLAAAVVLDVGLVALVGEVVDDTVVAEATESPLPDPVPLHALTNTANDTTTGAIRRRISIPAAPLVSRPSKSGL